MFLGSCAQVRVFRCLCSGALRAELYALVGPVRAELYAPVGPVRAGLYAPVGPVRAELYAPMGPVRAELYAPVGPVRAELYAPVDSSLYFAHYSALFPNFIPGAKVDLRLAFSAHSSLFSLV
uniref:Uncharacterized protein n=1 Tax=Periophthalmus magnuspinnatus TaxID=409849 RepID=A0A3B3Z6S8_9GOBI